MLYVRSLERSTDGLRSVLPRRRRYLTARRNRQFRKGFGYLRVEAVAAVALLLFA